MQTKHGLIFILLFVFLNLKATPFIIEAPKSHISMVSSQSHDTTSIQKNESNDLLFFINGGYLLLMLYTLFSIYLPSKDQHPSIIKIKGLVIFVLISLVLVNPFIFSTEMRLRIFYSCCIFTLLFPLVFLMQGDENKYEYIE